MILEIALGIVLAVLILRFLPQLLALSGIALIGAAGLVAIAAGLYLLYLGWGAIQNPHPNFIVIALFAIVALFIKFTQNHLDLQMVVMTWLTTIFAVVVLWFSAAAYLGASVSGILEFGFEKELIVLTSISCVFILFPLLYTVSVLRKK